MYVLMTPSGNVIGRSSTSLPLEFSTSVLLSQNINQSPLTLVGCCRWTFEVPEQSHQQCRSRRRPLRVWLHGRTQRSVVSASTVVGHQQELDQSASRATAKSSNDRHPRFVEVESRVLAKSSSHMYVFRSAFLFDLPIMIFFIFFRDFFFFFPLRRYMAEWVTRRAPLVSSFARC